MHKGLLILLVPLVFIIGCAQQGSPSGGPRDITPPRVISSEPENYSSNFSTDRILITFDEYIVLSDVNQELIVSPPMEEKPEIKLRKKTIIIDLEEALKENTTYTFNFGNAIGDLHEGNTLENFEFVLSTGDVVDSLSVRGNLKKAFDLTISEEPVTIMLYTDLRDSVPLTDIPYYVGKSNKEGRFSVNNLKSEVYKVFALKDANYNLLFDLPNEEIAFLDTSLIVSAEYFRTLLKSDGTLDSIQQAIDSAMVALDSAVIDTDSVRFLKDELNSVYVDLYLFIEDSELQFLSEYNRDDPRKLELVFNRPLTDTFEYRVVSSMIPNPDLFLEVFGKRRDSLTLWARDSMLYKQDTIEMALTYTTIDSASNPVLAYDTVYLNYRKKTEKRGRNKTEKAESLEITTRRSNQSQDLFRELLFKFNFPVTGINKQLIYLYEIVDSTEIPVSFKIRIDSTEHNKAFMDHPWESGKKYKMNLFPGAFENLYNLEHDTILATFIGEDIEHYGRILLNIDNVNDDIIIQLHAKEKLIREKKTDKSGQVIFPYLEPDTYSIKIIHDRNRNGRWDTGKYIKKTQPEKVEILPAEITVRSNWDHDATFTLQY